MPLASVVSQSTVKRATQGPMADSLSDSPLTMVWLRRTNQVEGFRALGWAETATKAKVALHQTDGYVELCQINVCCQGPALGQRIGIKRFFVFQSDS